MNHNITVLNNKIIKCRLCTRLIKFRKKIVKNKRNNLLMKNIGASQLQDLVMQMEKYYL